jgi:hypothetical protein
MVKHGSRPFIFSCLQVGDRWIACGADGTITTFDLSDLIQVDAEDCLREFQSNKYWATQKVGNIEMPGLSREKIDKHRERYGYAPELSEQEIDKTRHFWMSLGGGAFEFDLEINEQGVVTAGRVADKPLNYPLKEGSAKSANEILNELLKMRFRYSRLLNKTARLRFIVVINSAISDLISQTSKDQLLNIDNLAR